MKIFLNSAQIQSNGQTVVGYNGDIEVLSSTGMTLVGRVSTDQIGITISVSTDSDIVHYTNEREVFFALEDAKQLSDEEGGLLEIEQMEIENEETEGRKTFKFCNDNRAIVEESNGDWGIYQGVNSVKDYVKQYED